MSEFSKILKDLRSKTDYKQIDIAHFLDISVQSYSAYENGREPNYDILIKLSEIFDVPTDYLLGITQLKSYIVKLDSYKYIQDIITKEDIITNEHIATILNAIQAAIDGKNDEEKDELLTCMGTAFACINMYFDNIKIANKSEGYLMGDADDMVPILKILKGFKDQRISYSEIQNMFISQPQINGAIKNLMEFIYRYTNYTFDFSRLNNL